jgi:glutamine synthetase
MNKKDVKDLVEKKDIKWIQLHFTDIIGTLRVLHIPANRFFDDNILKKGINFDGSSIGFRNVEKSDMIALPDIETFKYLSYKKDEAMIRADLYDTDYEYYRADPRNILKKAVEKVKKEGYDEVKISPEMEFCSFNLKDTNQDVDIREKTNYFSSPPLDNLMEYRKKLSDVLMESGYHVKYHHHEKGKFQHEIEVKELEGVNAADFCSFFKFVSREIAAIFNIDITFMPKPLSDEAGNGMHAHIALYKNGKNMFLDDSNQNNLSQTALYFIGGILDHSRGIAALANPTLNSYKRLIPNFEAPIYIAWDLYNRSSLIRIPARKNIDIEIRNADPAANTYLLFSAFIYAGLDGIKKKVTYNPVSKNIYKMSNEEIKKYKIKQLPTNLMEALEEFENDNVLINSIGRDAADLFIQKKRNEWNRYMGEITDLDYEFYFNC